MSEHLVSQATIDAKLANGHAWFAVSRTGKFHASTKRSGRGRCHSSEPLGLILIDPHAVPIDRICRLCWNRSDWWRL